MSSDSFMMWPLSSITGTVPPRSLTTWGLSAGFTSTFSYSMFNSANFRRTFSQYGQLSNWYSFIMWR